MATIILFDAALIKETKIPVLTCPIQFAGSLKTYDIIDEQRCGQGEQQTKVIDDSDKQRRLMRVAM
jgi:hypothetical protein